MQAELDRWEKELRQNGPLPAPSLRQAWALALSDADVTIDESLQKGFQKLWDATEEEAQKAWDEWLKLAKKDPALGPPRRELARLILNGLTDVPRDIEKAGQRRRRYYRLTASGKTVLSKQRAGWREFVEAINLITGIQHA